LSISNFGGVKGSGFIIKIRTYFNLSFWGNRNPFCLIGHIYHYCLSYL